jgi:peptide/nickel transport system permease protein
MVGYILRRTVWAVVLFLVITLTTFVLFFILPTEHEIFVRRTETNPDEVRQALRLHGGVFHEYGLFVWNLLHGFLGASFVNRQDVATIVLHAAPVTAGLVLGGAILWLLISIPVGILSAVRPHSLLDRTTMTLVLLGISVHPVFIGLMLSYFFGFKLHWMPISGYADFFNPPLGQHGGPVQWAYHMVLPWLSYSLLFAALYTRMVRASVLEAFDDDHIRTARAKGASEFRVLRVHVLRNAMLPIVTMLGMDIGVAFGGAVFVENVFGLPGLGRIIVQSLRRQDLPVILGVVVVATTAILVFNLLVDVLYAWLDPRIGNRPGRAWREPAIVSPAGPAAWGSTRSARPVVSDEARA